MYPSSHARKKVIELETLILPGIVLFCLTDMPRTLGHVGISFEVEYKNFQEGAVWERLPISGVDIYAFPKILHSRPKI